MPITAAPPSTKKTRTTEDTVPAVKPFSLAQALAEERQQQRDASRELWALAVAEAGGSTADGRHVLRLLKAAGYTYNGGPNTALWEGWVERAAQIAELKPIAARLDAAQKTLDKYRADAQNLIKKHRQAQRHAAELRGSISAVLKREGVKGADIARRKAELLAEAGHADVEVARLAAQLEAARQTFASYSRGEWSVAARAATALKDLVPPEAR